MAKHVISTELGVLILLSVFAASMWIPFIVGVNIHTQDGDDNFTRPPPLSNFPPWVHRAHRAHLNLMEQFVPFAILVLIVDRLDAYSSMTSWTAIAFFWIRLTHAVGMIAGIARFPLRPLIFLSGWACCLIMAIAAYVH